MKLAAPCCAIVCVSSFLFAEDFKTINGKEYKNATVTRVEPDGILLKTKSGITKVYFVELPKEVQERFRYDPANAAQFIAAEQAATSTSNAAAEGDTKRVEAEAKRRKSAEELHLEVTEVLPNGILADPLERHEDTGPAAVTSRLGRLGGGGGCMRPAAVFLFHMSAPARRSSSRAFMDLRKVIACKFKRIAMEPTLATGGL